MFKSLGNLIHQTPWWGLAFGGLFILLALVMFATPIHLLRLSDSGKTPAEKSAIKREINLAFGGQALSIAESVVSTMKSRVTDPDRIRELDRALAEMARARDELSQAQSGGGGPGSEAARSAADAALATAMTAAESAVESATDAREAIAEAKDEAVTKLRSKGRDTSSVARSFDELLQSAKDSEKTAREAMSAIEALQHDAPRAAGAGPATPPQGPLSTPPKAAPAPGPSAAPPGKASAPSIAPGKVASPAAVDKTHSEGEITVSGKKGPKATIIIGLDPELPTAAMLSPATRDDIRAKVAGDMWRIGVGSALILLFIPLFVVLLIAKYYIGRSRRALAFAEEKKQEARISDVSRQVTEARLQALQAQVEPHFLYNTLANVQALTEFDPPAANAMVGHLIQYLRAALPKMRESTSTIGQEVELVTAYLNILKMRMGSRLEFGIDVAPELLTKSFPPMMLPSLVENAIKHGLEPLREGGRIDVIATRVATAGGERIRLQVRDTGRGLAAAPAQAGGGIGLANLHERLAGLYGDHARFTIESNTPQGAVATIEVPVEVPVEKSPPTPGADGVTVATAAPAAPVTGWRRAWQATSKTHSVWAWIASRLFFGLMFLLALVFLLALIGLYTGWMPVDIGDLQLHGIEGMALGSVLLLVGFAVAALAIAIVVAVFYGLGFLFAGLLVLVPAIILISLFPVLAPFILIGLAIYWFWWKKKKASAKPDAV